MLTGWFSDMKGGRILNILLAVFLALWLGSSLYLHSDGARRTSSEFVTRLLHKYLEPDASVGNATLLRPCGISLDDLLIHDVNGDTLAAFGNVSVRFNPIKAIRGEYEFTSIRLTHPDIRLSKDSISGDPNWKYLADKFQGGGGMPDLRLNSIIVRNGCVSSDVLSEEPTDGRLNASHIRLTGLDADLSVKALTKDSTNVLVRSLKADEQCGLSLTGLSGRIIACNGRYSAENLKISMPGTKLDIDRATADTKQENPHAAITTGRSYITPADLSPVIPQLASFTDRLDMRIKADGWTDGIQIDTLALASRTGELAASGSGHISGFTSADDIDIKDLKLKVTTGDGFAKYLDNQLAAANISIPAQAAALGSSVITLTGNGSKGNLTADATVDSKAGKASASFSERGKKQNLSLNTTSFDLGKILGNKELGKATLIASAERTFTSPGKFSGTAKASAQSLTFKNYTYKDLKIDGDFTQDGINLGAKYADDNAALDADVRYHMRGGKPEALANLRADSVNLAALGFMKSDSISIISADVRANLTGSGIDNINGEVTAYDISYINSQGVSNLNSFSVIMKDVPGTGKVLSVTSDVLTASVIGEFTPTTLASSLVGMLREPLPALHQRTADKMNLNPSKVPGNRLVADVRLQQTDIVGNLTGSKVSLDGVTTLHCYLSDNDSRCDINLHVPDMTVGKFHVTGGSMTLRQLEEVLSLTLTGEGGNMEKTPVQTGWVLSATDNRIGGLLTWQKENIGEFEGSVIASVKLSDYDRSIGSMRSQFQIDTTNITFRDVDWHLSPATIIADSGFIDISNLKLAHLDQHIYISGRASADSSDYVHVSIQDIDLEDILSMAGGNKLGFKGRTSGTVSAMALLGKPAFIGHLESEGFEFMETYGGNLVLDAGWNGRLEQVEITADMTDADISTTHATGVYVPKADSIDVTLLADHTDLNFLNRFMPKTIFNETSGRATGRLRMFGQFHTLDLEGDALLTDGRFDVVPNNTVYLVKNDTLHFTPGHMAFTGIHVTDLMGHTAMMDCTLDHKHLKIYDNIQIGVDSRDIQIIYFPESAGSTISGRVFINGLASLAAIGNNTYISGTCSTAPGSWFNVDLSDRNTSDYNFLTIVSRKSMDEARELNIMPEEAKAKRRNSLTSMNLNLNCTDNTDIGLTVSSLNGSFRGKGDISIKYDDVNGLYMNGLYNATQGNCSLTIQDLMKKEFGLMDGSSVRFTGNPSETELNLHTYHMVNSASLYDLDASASTSTNTRVRCLMDVTGSVGSPELSFDVDLPQGTAEEKDILASATGTEEQRNMQFMYLLAVGRFYTYDFANQSAANGLSPSTMESLLNSTVSGQINNLLAEIFNTDVFSLSSNVSAGNYLTNNAASFVNKEFEGILEAHLLNNRLLFNGNFGYRENAITNSQNIIGDFEIKWLMLPKQGISLKGYSRNNDRYFTKTTLTTQGVGLVYEKDFDRLFGGQSAK